MILFKKSMGSAPLTDLIANVGYRKQRNGIINVFFECKPKYFEDYFDFSKWDVKTQTNIQFLRFIVDEQTDDLFDISLEGEYDILVTPLKHEYLITFIPVEMASHSDTNKFKRIKIED